VVFYVNILYRGWCNTMRKFGRLFLAVFLTIFSSMTIVNAASKCSYDEQAKLNNEVANIKVSYEEATRKTGNFAEQEDGQVVEIVYDIFKISIYNLTEDYYVKITNDYNNEIKYIRYSDTKSGVGVYEWDHLDKVTNFKIMVYSSNKTNCPNEEYRILDLVTPKYNFYSTSAMCVGNEDFYLCQKYVAEADDIDITTFETKLSSFLETKEADKDGDGIPDDEQQSFGEKIHSFIKDNKITIRIISTIIVVGGVVAIVMVIKKRRSRLI